MLENIFGGHVPDNPFLKDLQNLLSGDSGFKSSAFEFVHGCSVAIEREGIWPNELRHSQMLPLQ
jgi:hypothetical protein